MTCSSSSLASVMKGTYCGTAGGPSSYQLDEKRKYGAAGSAGNAHGPERRGSFPADGWLYHTQSAHRGARRYSSSVRQERGTSISSLEHAGCAGRYSMRGTLGTY